MDVYSPVVRTIRVFSSAFVAAVGRLDKSLSPSVTISRLRAHTFTASDSIYIFHLLLALLWLYIMEVPGFPLKLLIPALFTAALLVPFTSQFFFRAIPIFAWLLTFYSARFIPPEYRPTISVVLLPTLESVLYGANISDILTRFTHPMLDIIAWLPYGVVHFIFPFFVAIFLWLFRSQPVLHLWARAFGYMNLTGVLIQILVPCSPPWYELIYGLTPANYGMPGSAGGLARIDRLFGSSGYQVAFSNSPVVFGAFPSLHAGNATIAALFMSHFFPWCTRFIWGYAAVLYWATMYLTHHYLIDVVSGACLAVAAFYFFLPEELKGPAALAPPTGPGGAGYRRSKYEQYDLDEPRRGRRGLGGAGGNGHIMRDAADYDLEDLSDRESDEEEMDITYRSPAIVQSDGGAAPPSARPLMGNGSANGGVNGASGGKVGGGGGKSGKEARGQSHRHTASIASLIRADERAAEDEGWSPIGGSFVFPSSASGAVGAGAQGQNQGPRGEEGAKRT